MGSYTSRFHHGRSQLDVEVYQRQYDPEWIVDHSRVTGLPILQIQRLWQRYQQLGSQDGTIKPSQLPLTIKNDPFSRLIFSKLQDKDTGSIHFLTFCNFCAWLESVNTDTKLKAIFQLVSKGRDMDKDNLYSVMKATFPRETEASVFKLTDIVMRGVDEDRNGVITEDQFVRFLKRLPESQLNRILNFNIIPDYIDQNPNQQEQIQETYRSTASEHSKQIPTDFILMEVAQKACRRDWYMLGNLLNFTSNQMSQFDQQNQEPREKTFAMLKSWRDREGKRAHLIKLEKALRQSGMNDIAMILQP